MIVVHARAEADGARPERRNGAGDGETGCSGHYSGGCSSPYRNRGSRDRCTPGGTAPAAAADDSRLSIAAQYKPFRRFRVGRRRVAMPARVRCAANPHPPFLWLQEPYFRAQGMCFVRRCRTGKSLTDQFVRGWEMTPEKGAAAFLIQSGERQILLCRLFGCAGYAQRRFAEVHRCRR